MPAPASKHYKWKEITDLIGNIDSLRDRELESLGGVWATEKERLGGDKRESDFNVELAREWAIETGIIEDVYTLDRGITQTLIERGIDSAYIPHNATNRDPELVARIIQAHADVLEGLFSFIGCERPLSTGYIKEVHSALLRHINTVLVFDQFGQSFDTALDKGVYKAMPNNPTRPDGATHEYCPPEHVASEMDRLIAIHQRHMADNVPSYIEAAWLHHAFTQIHPFQDGNGRVARTLATLVLVKGGFFPLVIHRDDRAKYIEALEAADEGDLSNLTQLFAQVQKRALTRAISKAVDVRPVKSVDEALAATRDMLVGLGRIIPKEYLRAKLMAHALANVTITKFTNVATRLREDIGQVNSAFEFSAGTLAEAPIKNVRLLAENLRYDPNPSDYNNSPVLILKSSGVSSSLVVSFHSVGVAFRGLIVALGYFQTGDDSPLRVSEDVFRINYQEALNEVSPRFEKWLDICLIEGLARWRRTLV